MMLRLARSRLLTAVIIGAGLFGFAATAGVANTVWQQDTENRAAMPGAGSFQIRAPAQSSNQPAITLTFTYNTSVMTSPVDPLVRTSGRYNYAIHADTVSLTVT